MAIRAIVFDIGGVLEITPRLGIDEKWEAIWHLQPGELNKKLYDVWKGGSIGTITEAEVYKKIGEIMGLDEAEVNAFMDDTWREYLGTLNVELLDYFRSLHGRFKTGILSNSFVGAREREQALYHFDEMTDVIVYSHEVGMQKPNPEIYKLTWEKLDIQPHEMIFLDDRDAAIDPANALGIHGIVFKDNAQTIADIEACIKANA
ncbi:MAG: HAD family phosphatase [Chloroflexota bacterium]